MNEAIREMREVDYPVCNITVGKRRRQLGDVSTLAASIAEIGLMNRIHILPDGGLVAGLHRLEACKSLGWQTIPARIVKYDEIDAELAEIDENLRRNELTVLEQAEHLLRREELLQAKGLRAQSGTNLKNGSTGVTVTPVHTTANIAAEMGIGENSAQKRLQIARDIAPDVKESIAQTEIADSTRQLLALARMEPEQQRQVADRIVTGEAETVKEAVQQIEHESGATAFNNHMISATPGYDGDEWYTPVEIVTAARQVLEVIDLDPATCEAAQVTIGAETYFTKTDDALRPECEWVGRVWLNPPYSMPLIRQFVTKLNEQYDAGNVKEAIIITNNSSDTAWFHSLLGRYPACFTFGRVGFWRPDHEDFGTRQGQTLFYLGDNVQKFCEAFREIGKVVSGL